MRSEPPAGTVPIRIRQAVPGDAAAWTRLRAELWPEGTPEEHAEDVRQFFERPTHQAGDMPEAVLLAVEEDRVVGFAELSRRAYAEGCESSPVGYLEGWYVVPHCRRKGVGRALLDHFVVWAGAMGCREVASDAVTDNVISARAHRALGFDEVVAIRCFRRAIVPDA